MQRKKKGLVASVALVILAIGAIGAYAYFTTSGSGTGAASVGSDTPLTITQTNTISGLVPDGPAQNVVYDIVNAAGNGAQNLGKVTITGIAVTQAPSAVGSCTSSDFTVTAPASAVGTIADGATFSSVAAKEPTIQMTDTGSNQDGCKGATLSLTLSAAQGS